MKTVWVVVEPWSKDLVTAALESGVEAVVVPTGKTPEVKELGRIKTVSADGDIRPDVDVVTIEVCGKEDEERAASQPADRTVVLRMRDWTVIPLENILARRGNVMVEVQTADNAALVTQVLERGADGVVLRTRDPEEIRRTVKLVKSMGERLSLVEARIERVQPLGMGDRVCIDTITQMVPGQGMLVGNASSGFFLVHAETIQTPYVETRPFRVNAGGVHAYVMVAGGKTKYLSELQSGDAVLLVAHDGRTEESYVGRVKVEKRPMMLVAGDVGGKPVSLVLQNAETIRLTRPDGCAVSVAQLKPGDVVLAYVTEGGRHFGMKVQESLTER